MKQIIAFSALAILGACVYAQAAPDSFVPQSAVETNLESFEGVELRGGGDITIRQGASHSFENTGSANAWEIGVLDDHLILSCPGKCNDWKRQDRTAIITLPNLEDVALKGGGDIVIEGEFPNADELNIALMGGGDIKVTGYFPSADEVNIAISGGGDIDAFNVNAKEANIAIKGGGDITVSARDELNVSILGGGDIKYRGNPEISKSILGGGTVRPAQ